MLIDKQEIMTQILRLAADKTAANSQGRTKQAIAVGRTLRNFRAMLRRAESLDRGRDYIHENERR